MDEPLVVVRAQDLGEVALKLGGLGFIFLGVMSVPGLFNFASFLEGSTRNFLGQATYGVSYLTLGACLIRWSAGLSRRLFGSTATTEIPLPVAVELQTVAFRIMGIFILANGLPMLVQSLVESTSEDLRIGAFSMIGFVGTEVSLGVVLLFYRSAWVLRVWRKLRPTQTGRNPA